MTREEEKELASEEYIKSTLVGSPYIKKASFKRGVEWGDEHPRKGLVDIDKVYKWLEENLHMYNTSECKGDRIAFVEDFKKAMEEQL